MPTDFLPSQHGFGFPNAWPDEPAVEVRTELGTVSIGNAKAGLCGGMVFAALDFWHAAAPVPSEQPAGGSPLYRFIVRRLIDSWHLPAGVAQYFHWMCLPDGDSGFDVFGRHVLTERGIAWRTVRDQWPQIRTDLDNGNPVALGIITVASRHPRDLGKNHQVLAYGYDIAGPRVSIRVYDPNQGRRDDIELSFDTSEPTRPTAISHNLGLGQQQVRGFFRTPYSPAAVPSD